MDEVLRFRIGDDPPLRLDKALSRDVPAEAALSRSRIGKLLGAGAVRVDGVQATGPTARVAAGAMVEIALAPPVETDIGPEAIALDVRHEDADLIVLVKPAGMVVHPAPGSPSGTLVNALLAHCGADLSGIGGERRPGIVHRIDKDTSGLLVAAKSDRAHHGLAAQFAAHSVERAYLAICHGVPDVGDPRLRGLPGVRTEPGGVLRVATRIGRHRTDRQRQAVSFTDGRHAVTRVRMLEPLAGTALLECRLETGRTHQIRVHMAHIGHGLIGDPVYGGRRRLSGRAASARAVAAAEAFPRQALHAATLGFVHPVTGATLRFDAPVPADMADLLDILRT